VAFEYENPELERALEAARSFDQLEDVFQRLSRLVPSFVDPAIRGRQMFAHGLDRLVPVVARRLGLADVPGTRGNENVCIVATRFYTTGGHSKVAADISRLVGRSRTTIVFTDLYRQLKHRSLIGEDVGASPYQRRATVLLSAPTMIEKTVELYMALAAIRPTRIFLMCNHMDLVAVAGVWPFRDVVEFVHHADHMPVIGATLPFSAHADLTYMCHEHCKQAGAPARYVGMTNTKAEPSGAARPASAGGLRFATCGALHKFRQAARHRWADFVIAALRNGGAEFLHIGQADETFRNEMQAALSSAGLDPDLYRFTGSVPDLKQALIDNGVDVYVASYPDTGARAILDAMMAGLAPVVPVPGEIGGLLQFKVPLPHWVKIAGPDELPEAAERSLALSEQLRSPEGQAALREELDRFEDYVLAPDRTMELSA
jgi:hypothetical protein